MTSGAPGRVVLIAGPTASGKSALALRIARKTGATIVNADAMQVYGTLRVLTARPSDEELALAPHRLYGHIHPGQRFSTGAWLRQAADEVRGARIDRRALVFVGGTGLYFDALLKGLADIPNVPGEIVRAIEDEIAGLDAAGRARLLAKRDPATAARLAVPDPQRVVRALAVLAHTGRPLASFQEDAQPAVLEGTTEKILINPPVEILRERIARRFRAMWDGGALEEVEALLAMGLDPSLPVMKAIGVAQIAAWQRGEIGKDEAIRLSVIATRQYAKRQRTWMRNRFEGWRPWDEGLD